MKFSGWSNFEDLARACGYTNSTNSNYKSESNNSNNDNTSTYGCSDIPNGFQSLNPELFVIIGTILGEIIAGNIPFNVQNALGNWFTLLGQVIITYNSQQQYFEQGPGTCFNPRNFNSNNSFCSNNSTNSNNSTSNNSTPSNNSTSNNDNPINNNSSLKNSIDKINALEKRLNELMNEIKKIKNKI